MQINVVFLVKYHMATHFATVDSLSVKIAWQNQTLEQIMHFKYSVASSFDYNKDVSQEDLHFVLTANI